MPRFPLLSWSFVASGGHVPKLVLSFPVQREEEIRQTVLADGSCSCFGRILGYPFAGELDEIHCCEGRFRVNLKSKFLLSFDDSGL